MKNRSLSAKELFLAGIAAIIIVRLIGYAAGNTDLSWSIIAGFIQLLAIILILFSSIAWLRAKLKKDHSKII